MLKPMAEDRRERLNRKYVIWCVVNGMPWKAVDNIGFKLIIAEWDPVLAATPPSFQTLDRVFLDMYDAAKAEMIKIIDGVRRDNKNYGYDGPFCSLQIDRTSEENVEYMALSIQLIRFVVVSAIFVLLFYFPFSFLLSTCSIPGNWLFNAFTPWKSKYMQDRATW